MPNMASRSATSVLVVAMMGGVCSLSPVRSEEVETFYKGRNIQLVIATSAGGDYDIRARLIARNIGRHIPGNPQVIPQNMPGGGGLQAANWVASVASRDGTVLVSLVQSAPMNQLMDGEGVRYDAGKFLWIGNTTSSPNTVVTWHTTGVRTLEEAKQKEVVLGAGGLATQAVFYPLVMNATLGTKFKLIHGYPGGNETNMAMERGETGGRGSNSWASWVATKPDWLREKKINILVQIGLKKHPQLADVPLLMELGQTPEDRAILRFMSTDTEFSRAINTTEGVPAARLEALRRAFDATMKDPQFLSEIDRLKADLSTSTGEEVQRIVADYLATPRSVVDRAKSILGSASK